MIRSLENSDGDSPQDEDMDISVEDEHEKEVPFDLRFYEGFRTSHTDDYSKSLMMVSPSRSQIQAFLSRLGSGG